MDKKFVNNDELKFWRRKLAEDYIEWDEGRKDSSFKIIDDELIRTYYLTDGEKNIYIRLLTFVDFLTGQTFVSDERLQLETGKSRRSIQRILASLEDKGMIKRLATSPNSKRYICLLPYPNELYENIYQPNSLEP